MTCTCRLGTVGVCPVWYADLRDCPEHGHLYRSAATPQWFVEQERNNAAAAVTHSRASFLPFRKVRIR